MFSFTPSLSSRDTTVNLEKLILPDIEATQFQPSIQSLRSMFAAFTAFCPPPWPAPGLIVTPEIHYQSELWLPLAVISPIFQRFYRSALSYPPIISSTPFSYAASWAAIVSSLPGFLGQTTDPASLLECLLKDYELRTRFICWSFMPPRFYGDGSARYPVQTAFIREWLNQREKDGLRCMDAACGDGAGSYGLARILLELEWKADKFKIEGWTIDPLESWAASHCVFPHDPAHESTFRRWTAPLFEQEAQSSLTFRQVDLQQLPKTAGNFDIIICNGLLGGPFLHRLEQIQKVVEGLSMLLRPRGLLLAADHFHGGWKKNIPKETLGDIFKLYNLHVMEAGEGIVGLKPDQ